MAHRSLGLLLLALCCSQHWAATATASTPKAAAASLQQAATADTPSGQDVDNTNAATVAAATNEYEGDMVAPEAPPEVAYTITDATGTPVPGAAVDSSPTTTVTSNSNSDSRRRGFFSWWESGTYKKQQQQQQQQQQLEKQEAASDCASPGGCSAGSNVYEGETVAEAAERPIKKAAPGIAAAASAATEAEAATATGATSGDTNAYEGETVSEAAQKPVAEAAPEATAAAAAAAAAATEDAQESSGDAAASDTYEAEEVTEGAAQPAAAASGAELADSNAYEGEIVAVSEAVAKPLAAAAAADPAAASTTATSKVKEAATNIVSGAADTAAVDDVDAVLQLAATNAYEGPTVADSAAQQKRKLSAASPAAAEAAAAAGSPSPTAAVAKAAPASPAAAGTTAGEPEPAELTEAMGAMFKPVYSWDPSTHAQEHNPDATKASKPSPHRSHGGKSLEVAPAAGTAAKPGDASSTAAAANARRYSRPVSVNDADTSLGLAGMPVPGTSLSSSSQQQPAQAQSVTSQLTAPVAGSNAPGAFTGGPSLTPQHSDWHSDNLQSKADDEGTFVAAGGTPGAINKNVFGSLNNDLAFYLSKLKAGPRKALRRNLLDAPMEANPTSSSSSTAQQQNEDQGAVDYEGVDDNAAAAAGSEVPKYPAAAFDLPAAAVQAATLQVQELQQMLAAQRVPRVQVEKAVVPDISVLSSEVPIDPATAGSAATQQQQGSKNSRKLLLAEQGSSSSSISLLNGGKAGKPLWGVTYSWRREHACDGARQVCRCPSPEELDADLDLLYRYSYRMRTYSVECPELMRMLLHHTTANPQVSWLLGLWIGRDAAANKAQIDLLGKLLAEFPDANLAGIAVGNEAISRGDVTEQQLLQYIAQVREVVRATARKAKSKRLAAVPVLTVELPAAFSPELVAAVDAVGAVIQPFFTGAVDTSQKSWAKSAVAVALQQFRQLQDEAQGKPVFIAEIGWPSRSGEVDSSRSGMEHAAAFAQAWMQVAEKHGIAYFYHELADAGWKTALRQGAALALTATRTLKGLMQPHGLQQQQQQQPSLLAQGVLGDEHFGLVSADRRTDKGIVLHSRSKVASVAAE